MRRTDIRLQVSRAVVGGHRTRLLTVAGDGPPVVLLHGFSDSADTWRPLLRELGRAGRHAVAADLPGFGQAGPLPRGAVMGVHADFVRALVTEVGGGEPVVLVGNSMGGAEALLAWAEPDLPLAAVAAVSPAGLGFHPQLERVSDVLDRVLPVLRLAYRVPYPRPVVKAACAAYYGARLSRAGGLEMAWRYGSHFQGMDDFRRVGALGRVLMAELRAAPIVLTAADRPLLLVWGDRDPVCDVRGAQAVLDTVPTARLEVVAGAGHLAQVDRPDVVADLLLGLTP